MISSGPYHRHRQYIKKNIVNGRVGDDSADKLIDIAPSVVVGGVVVVDVAVVVGCLCLLLPEERQLIDRILLLD